MRAVAASGSSSRLRSARLFCELPLKPRPPSPFWNPWPNWPPVFRLSREASVEGVLERALGRRLLLLRQKKRSKSQPLGALTETRNGRSSFGKAAFFFARHLRVDFARAPV